MRAGQKLLRVAHSVWRDAAKKEDIPPIEDILKLADEHPASWAEARGYDVSEYNEKEATGRPGWRFVYDLFVNEAIELYALGMPCSVNHLMPALGLDKKEILTLFKSEVDKKRSFFSKGARLKLSDLGGAIHGTHRLFRIEGDWFDVSPSKFGKKKDVALRSSPSNNGISPLTKALMESFQLYKGVAQTLVDAIVPYETVAATIYTKVNEKKAEDREKLNLSGKGYSTFKEFIMDVVNSLDNVDRGEGNPTLDKDLGTKILYELRAELNKLGKDQRDLTMGETVLIYDYCCDLERIGVLNGVVSKNPPLWCNRNAPVLPQIVDQAYLGVIHQGDDKEYRQAIVERLCELLPIQEGSDQLRMLAPRKQ